MIQPLIGIGGNDLTDLTANTFGAFLGAGMATTILLGRDAITEHRIDQRRLGKLATTSVVTIGLALSLSIGGARAIQSTDSSRLEAMFSGTTLADYKKNEEAWGRKIQASLRAERMPTVDSYSNDTVAVQRFTWTFYWTTRCTIARWDAHGFTTHASSGSQCIRRLW